MRSTSSYVWKKWSRASHEFVWFVYIFVMSSISIPLDTTFWKFDFDSGSFWWSCIFHLPYLTAVLRLIRAFECPIFINYYSLFCTIQFDRIMVFMTVPSAALRMGCVCVCVKPKSLINRHSCTASVTRLFIFQWMSNGKVINLIF